ncbi:MAG: hypothetical protein HMLKMBBP_02647 [Planctomycetes bacterium]|nr:hypothetical protein [Planctomycetota bacterium]
MARLDRLLRPALHLIPPIALVALVAMLWTRGCGDDPPAPPPPPPVPADLGADEQATVALFERASPSVVHVAALELVRNPFSGDGSAAEVPHGTGTGFIWDAAGHVVTNCHVVTQFDGRGNAVAKFDTCVIAFADKSTRRAKVIGRAPSYDLAVLEFTEQGPLPPPLDIGTSAGLRVGQKTFVIGNPFALDQTLTTGIISGLNRQITSLTGRPIFDVIQTDAAINLGNSGGPVLSSQGKVIGIATQILSPSGGSAGIAFAIPADLARRIVPDMIRRGGDYERPMVGVRLAPDDMAERNGIDGLLVGSVVPGSPAAEAGMTGVQITRDGAMVPGDVILSADGVRFRMADDLHRFLDTRDAGADIVLRVRRGEDERDVRIRLGAGW